MSAYIYNITRWDGARFGPFAKMEEAMDAAPKILAKWKKPGDTVRFDIERPDFTHVALQTGHHCRRPETLSIRRQASPLVVGREYFAVDGHGVESAPHCNVHGAVNASRMMFLSWFGSAECVGDKSEPFSVTIHARPKLGGTGVREAQEAQRSFDGDAKGEP